MIFLILSEIDDKLNNINKKVTSNKTKQIEKTR